MEPPPPSPLPVGEAGGAPASANTGAASTEEAELAIIQNYLPKAMDESEVRDIVRGLIASTSASGMGDLGKIMGPLMGKIRGRFDGKRASAIAREELNPN